MLFKTLLTTVLLALSTAVSAEIVPAESVDEAKKQAELKCKEGCLVLAPAEIAAIEMNIQLALEEAYQAGLKSWSKHSSAK